MKEIIREYFKELSALVGTKQLFVIKIRIY